MINRISNLVFPYLLIAVLIGCDKPIQPVPEDENDSEYAECLPALSEETFDIATWNIRFYPVSLFQRSQVIQIVEALDADIIALQEMTNKEDFDELVELLDGWEGAFQIMGGLTQAYIYKTSEVSVGQISLLFLGEFDAFPRPAAFLEATHVNGTQVSLINIHLKCCGDADDIASRAQASIRLKEYMDENLPDDKAILLGDFNDKIYSPSGETILFQNFIDDSNYAFADMELAKDRLTYSYPSWPSHIDHILITDELFDQVLDTQTLLLNNCSEFYESGVSDHLPVMISLK